MANGLLNSPELKAPARNRLLGWLADAAGGVYDYAQQPDPTMPMGKANPVLSLLADAVPFQPAVNVLNDWSYGQAPIRGTGMTTRLTPDATELALTALPFPKTSAKTVAALGSAGMVPGLDAAAYLAHTPLKPNPLVGTRYKTTDLGGIAPRTPMNWDDWEGASIMTYPTDMLSRNRRIDNVSDIQIASPATSVGGLMYAADLDNIANRIGYASNAAAATSQNNRAMRAIEENLRLGGSGRVLMAPHTMPRGGENFSTTPTEVALSIMDTVNPSTAALNVLSDRVRGATVKGVKGKYKDFVGFNDSGLRDQLFKGEGLPAGSAGDLRKVVIDKLSSVEAQKNFGFNYPDLQNAILDPNVMNKSPFLMGDTIFEALPHLGTSKGLHPAYSDNMPGVFVGNSSGAPISEFMGNLYARKRLGQVGKPGPRLGEFADPDQLTRGQLSTAGEDISMFLDKKQIKRLQGLLGP